MPATRITVVLLLTMAMLNSCGAQPNRGTQVKTSIAQSCMASGRLDSLFVVTQARDILAQPELVLQVRSYRPIREEGVDLGLIISLVPGKQPPVAGGGGLVWVDLETGCPIVLRRYE